MSNIERLLLLMARLRAREGGCAWDQRQTYASLVAHTLEEAYEVAEVIESGELEKLADEVGDLLFQVVFYCQIGQEEGHFDFESVAARTVDKLSRRHPHLFGGSAATLMTESWESIKAQERQTAAGGEVGVLHGVSTALPALVRAQKLQCRLASIGFDWTELQSVLSAVTDELDELRVVVAENGESARIDEELGDVLFSCVNLARHLGVDAEGALRRANRKIERRIAAMETICQEENRSLTELSLQALEKLWQQVKAKELTACGGKPTFSVRDDGSDG